MTSDTETKTGLSPEEDPFLYDTDQLHAIAGDSVVRQGLAYFKENRVMDLDLDENGLWAQVEGGKKDSPYTTKLTYEEDGSLYVTCDCGFVEEPVCKHAVAVLYAYTAGRAGGEESLTSAIDSAIEERTQRGRTEVKVTHLSGEPWFGAWRAASVTSTTHRPQSYQVHIRSLSRRSNYCTCPDFAVNQLGTCKHIEAVLHKVSKRRDYGKIKDQPPPYPFVYLAWDLEKAPRIRAHRTPGTQADLAKILDDWFDAAGIFKGRLPDDFFRFSDAVVDRSDIDLGEDARAHALRLASAAMHRARAREIRESIVQFGGQLPGIRARLYSYQVEGVAFLAANGRALLADDMGLGKTLQAIAAAAWLHRHAEAERILVVCPASLKQQWAREIEKFTSHQVQVVQGRPEARAVQYRRSEGFVIVNYELILRDLSVINKILSPDLVILDEAQRIKNWRTKIASFIKLIPSRYAFVLSGTPLENRLEDLYSLMQVVDPRVLGPLWRYLADFHVTDERGKVLGYRNLSELRRRLAPAMLRRDRRLVRDQLPDRIQQQLDVGMTVEQQELHNTAMTAAGSLAKIAKRRPLTPSESNRLMAALQQARMACNAAGLVDKETEGSPKLDELASLLDELCVQGGLKAVVFSQWERMTAMVEQLLRRMGLGHVRLHGGVPTAKRGDLMDRFREDDAVQVFISTDAGGVGLNLQSASVLINLDMPWNPAVLEQRIARIHRLGQKEKVQVILLVAADSYEQQVMGLIKGKRNLFDNVINPDASEDVVGISKKLLETLVEDLAGEPPKGDEQTAEAERLPTPADVELAPMPPRTTEDHEMDEAVRICVTDIQQAFGSRIERILGAGGGLLVVMDRVDADAERTAEQLSEAVPVALIDLTTLKGLQRLGSASPVGETKTYYEPPAEEREEKVPPLVAMAQQKLKAAEVLIEQQCMAGAVELLCSSLLAAAANRVGLDHPPAPREVGVWLYGEVLPKGLLTPEQGTVIMRAVALSEAQTAPEALIREVLEDARGFIGPENANSGNSTREEL
ncbi:MAG: DEAD/DEAH box helicase family protein [Gammaproteobacteria bacterium]|nr:DEAD/DEAH box helicase family protein [Gammaproteobacteria bacterium]